MGIITKHKKITIKFFLNKKIQEASDYDKGPIYPLYIQVTYDRRNMQLRSKYGEYYYDMDEVEKRGKGICEWEEKALRKIIRYELNRLGDKFELKGLSKKYDVYANSLQMVIDNYMKDKLWRSNMRINSDMPEVLDFKNARVPFANLLKASRMLFENHDQYLNDTLKEEIKAYDLYKKLYPPPYFQFSFATVIDWLEGEHRNEFKTYLESIYQNHPEKVQQALDVIDQIVTEHTAELES